MLDALPGFVIPSSLTIVELSPVIGAVVRGIDLSLPLDDAAIASITAALLRHQVLFFEDQNLSPERQRDFAGRFGTLHVHPLYPKVADVPEIIVLDTHPGNPTDNDNWHTDVTFIDTPPLGAVLAAAELPPSGGDTMWASLTAAYDALSLMLQHLLDGLTATHDFTKSFPEPIEAAAQEAWRKARGANPVVSHPVVRRHPLTGAKSLFVNFGFTTRINELTKPESDALLAFLFTHSAKPEFTVRWKWQAGSVAFWDNRVTQHYALSDYLPARRIMHRATVIGDRPIPARI